MDTFASTAQSLCVARASSREQGAADCSVWRSASAFGLAAILAVFGAFKAEACEFHGPGGHSALGQWAHFQPPPPPLTPEQVTACSKEPSGAVCTEALAAKPPGKAAALSHGPAAAPPSFAQRPSFASRPLPATRPVGRPIGE